MTSTSTQHTRIAKADPADFPSRWREIISDPLNLLIEKNPLAGFVRDKQVYLHNGNRVPIDGQGAYYGAFSYVLVYNRGVHEPLEEYVFQELLKLLPESPTMLELGAYWGHYSMWLKNRRPAASVHLIEPELQNLQAGMANFKLNNFTGVFVQAFVGKGHFSVDDYLQANGIEKLDILHADIQGFEVEMLDDCARALQQQSIDYIFISTHSNPLHEEVLQRLKLFNYRIEISSDFDHQTTSYDGFIFASSPHKEKVFNNFKPLGRVDIAESSPADLVLEISKTLGISLPTLPANISLQNIQPTQTVDWDNSIYELKPARHGNTKPS